MTVGSNFKLFGGEYFIHSELIRFIQPATLGAAGRPVQIYTW
jgi:hypothetical protein